MGGIREGSFTKSEAELDDQISILNLFSIVPHFICLTYFRIYTE